MLKIKELKKILKDLLYFFVLQLQEILIPVPKIHISLINIFLNRNLAEFQFTVFRSKFSVLIQTSVKLNSLYQSSNSLKN